MTTQDILTAVGLIGIGGLLKSLVDFLIAGKKLKSESQHNFKETGYKAIILLCYTFINFEREGSKLAIQRPDIHSKNQLFDELKAEWANMILFASDRVIKTMKRFLKMKNQKSFNQWIVSMGKDLYGLKTNIQEKDLLLKKKLDE
ncbi:MAG: hypothetical protein AAGH81_08330 [Bacteroidota bacterium]